MRHCNRGPFREQVRFLRRQFLQDGDLPFTNVLTEEVLARALVSSLCRVGPLAVDIDDTLFNKSGPRVAGAGNFRDPIRSSGGKVVYALGLNLVVATLRINPP